MEKMMKPIYYEGVFKGEEIEAVWEAMPWIRVAPRDECWMNSLGADYTYGSGRGIRTYSPLPFNEIVSKIIKEVNVLLDTDLDVCFTNGYRDNRDQLG